ncbi:hypothetical protein D3C87_1957870 [compost metagenome]
MNYSARCRATNPFRGRYRIVTIEQRNPGNRKREDHAFNQAVHEIHTQINRILHRGPEETCVNPFPLHSDQRTAPYADGHKKNRQQR